MDDTPIIPSMTADLALADPGHSLPNGRKPGRPADPTLTIYRALFPEWSERTIARYVACMRRLRVMGKTVDESLAVCLLAKRRNETVNVSKLDQITESMAAIWICEQEAGRG